MPAVIAPRVPLFPRVPRSGRLLTAPGPPTFDPARDSAYDQVVLADLPAYGAYWAMQETTGTSFADRGPMNVPLLWTPGGGALNDYIGPTPVDPRNISVRFKAQTGTSSARLQTRDFRFPGISPFSFELWIYLLGFPSNGANYWCIDNYNTGGWRLLLQGDLRRFAFWRVDKGGIGDTCNGGAEPAQQTWHHVVGTYDSASMRLYVDGVLVAGPTASSRLIDANENTPVALGSHSTLDGFGPDAYIARAALYSTALSQAQVTTHFQAGVATTWSPSNTKTLPISMFAPRPILMGRNLTSLVPAAVGSGITSPLGIVTEVDISQAFAKAKAKAFGLVSETDIAQSISRAKNKAIGLVLETDLAQSFSRAKSKALGLVTEIDLALSIAHSGISRAIGLVTETDLAQSIGRAKSRAIGLVPESDLAQSFARLKSRALGLTTETDAAQTVGRSKSKALKLVTSLNTALHISNGAVVAVVRRARTIIMDFMNF